MKCCAVVDTNVIVSALLSKKDDVATIQVLRAMLGGCFTPLYHVDILDEYEEIRTVITAIKQYGIEVFPRSTGEILADMDDLVFYEVAMEKREDGAYLVTGNQKHYPVRDFIVTPAEMMEILNR